MQNSGERRRGNDGVCLSAVIARSEATKRSRVARSALDCFASLAMTAERGLKRNATAMSSWRKPGPITTGLGSCDDSLPPNAADRFRGMGPGFRQDDGGAPQSMMIMRQGNSFRRRRETVVLELGFEAGLLGAGLCDAGFLDVAVAADRLGDPRESGEQR